MSYIAVILAVLLLLNTYPLLVSEDLVFHSKATNLQSSVSVMVNALSGLSPLTEENVADAMAVAQETGMSRILVTDGAGRVLYDTRETGSAVGNLALYTEIVQALLGYDAFSCTYRRGAFRSRASSPIMYQSQIIGAVYAYEYDTEQAALLEGLRSGKIRAAGLDVWATEKNPNQELVQHPAVSCTPHIGAGTREAQTRIGQELVDIVEGFAP